VWQDITGWGENDRGVSFTFGGDVVRQFLKKHNFSLIARAHQVFALGSSCIVVLVSDASQLSCIVVENILI